MVKRSKKSGSKRTTLKHKYKVRLSLHVSNISEFFEGSLGVMSMILWVNIRFPPATFDGKR